MLGRQSLSSFYPEAPNYVQMSHQCPHKLSQNPMTGDVVTADDKKRMATTLGELSKATSIASKLLVAADAALPGYCEADAEILQINVERLKASAEQAEEVMI